MKSSVMQACENHTRKILLYVAIMISNITLILVPFAYDNYFSSVYIYYAFLIAGSLLCLMVLWLLLAVRFADPGVTHTLILTLGVFTCVFTSLVCFGVLPDIPYSEECGVLAGGSSISRSECIEYAIHNPNTTGMQIIDAITEKNKKIMDEILNKNIPDEKIQIEDLFDRPLNP